MNKHRSHILACFDHLSATSAFAEDIKGRLKRLRGIAPGFRNPNHYTTRSIIRAAGFKIKLLYPKHESLYFTPAP